ncbi:MAG TPA: CsbD family protein [Xanthomonadaceae bacterium]|nr:CsbD family protein [Xanthomonadaceae bacterium]
MDNNRKEGAKRELDGAVKEGVGKVTGDRSQQLEGNIEKNTGKVQREVGKAADDVRESSRDTR